MICLHLHGCLPLQTNHSDDLSRSDSFSSQQENIHEIFDFSKIPDVDPTTRTRLGSEYLLHPLLHSLTHTHTQPHTHTHTHNHIGTVCVLQLSLWKLLCTCQITSKMHDQRISPYLLIPTRVTRYGYYRHPFP